MKQIFSLSSLFLSLSLSIMSKSAYELSVDLCRVYVWYLFLLRCLCVRVLLKEVMSSLRPSYCKKSSNGITSAHGTPTERSVIQNSCRRNQIHPAVLLPVLFPNGFYLGTFPLEIRMRSPLGGMSAREALTLSFTV